MSTEITALITQGFADLKDVVVDVQAIAIPAIVGVICLIAGANFALKKLRGVLSWA